MTKLSNKKKVLKLIILLVGFFYALGLNISLVSDNDMGGYSSVFKWVVLIVISVFFVSDTYLIFKSGKKFFSEKEHYLTQFFWAGSFFVLILLVNYLKPSNIALSFNYLLLSITFAFFNLFIALFFLLAILLSQYILLYNAPWMGDISQFAAFALLSVLFSLFGYLLKSEREKRHQLKNRLQDIEEGVKSFFDEEERAVLALKEEKRVEKLYNTFNFFEDKVLKILQEIKDLMEPYTVAFIKFKDDGRYYRIFEAISDNDYIRHNEDISSEEGIIGWIYKHKKSINLGNFRSGANALNYYDRETGIKSFMGMPVFWKDKIVGVLILDALQEDAFSKDGEKIVKIASREIEDALENAQLFQQIQQQNQEFGALYQASKKLLSFVSLEENLTGFLNLISTFISFDIAVLCLLEEDVLKVKSFHGFKENLMDKIVSSGSLMNWVVKHKQYLDIKRYKEKKKVNPIIDEGVKMPSLDRVLIYPFLIEERVIGAFMLGFMKGSISEYEKSVLEILTNQTSVAISNALLFEKVNLMATTDGLTGVYNHRYFQEKLGEEIERASRYSEKLVFMLLDIDFFKKVNDTYGHPVGDLVLKSVSKLLKTLARKVDIVARYGGEEFAVIMVQTAKEGGEKFAERIRKGIEESEVFYPGGKLKVTASIGLACFPDDAKDKSSLIAKADKALYKAKKTGRNKVISYNINLENEEIS